MRTFLVPASLLATPALLTLLACAGAAPPSAPEPDPAPLDESAVVVPVDEPVAADAVPEAPSEEVPVEEASDGVSAGGAPASSEEAPAAEPVSAKPSGSPPGEVAAADVADDGGAGDEGADGSADAAVADADDVVPDEAPTPEPATPVRYTLGSGSYAAVLVKYDRNATIKGHDHVLVAQTVKGSVTWTPGDPSACDVRVTLPASSLVVDPPGSRARAGLEGETSEGDKRKIRENALGKQQLEADKYPDLTFRSTSCVADGDRVKVTGDLTLHGQSKRVTTRMRITAEPDSFRARGRVSATHADYGMKPFTALLGALRNDESLTFDLDFKGTP